MNAVLRQNLFVFLALLLFSSPAVAYTVIFAPSEGPAPLDVALSETPSPETSPAVTSTYSYGPVSISTSAFPVDFLELDLPESDQLAGETLMDKMSLVGVAEAAMDPAEVIITNFMTQYGRLKESVSLDEVRTVMTQDAMAGLEEKLAAGVQEIMIVEMLKSMFPDMELEVYDAAVTPNEAVLAVRDARQRKDIQGVIVLRQESGSWKIQQAQWLEDPDYLRNPNPFDLVESTLLLTYAEGADPVGMKEQWEYAPYRLDSNVLSLQRVSNKFTKSSFVFVFLVERKKRVDPDTELPANKKTTSQLHILWTGPRQLVPQQRVYSDLRLPLDVSVAHYKQGYKSNVWNLRLPRRRPKEVSFVLLYKF